MAFVVENRVKESSNDTGTGDFSVGGAQKTYRSFDAVCNGGDTFPYTIAHDAADDWEIGIGKWDDQNKTIVRQTVLKSSNNDNKVDFGSGSKVVALTAPDERTPVLDANPSTGDVPVFDGNEHQPSSNAPDKAVFASGVDTRGDVVDDQNNTIYDYSKQQVTDGVLPAEVPLTDEAATFNSGLKSTPSLTKSGSVQDSVLEGAHDVEVEDNMAYVVGKGAVGQGTLAVVDFSDESNPEVLGGITSLVNAQTVQATGQYLLVGDDNGLHIYDKSRPASLSEISNVGSGSRINGMAVWETYVFAADKDGTIEVYDITDPLNPTHFGSYSGNISSPHDIDIKDDVLVVPDQVDGTTNKVYFIDAINIGAGDIRSVGSWTQIGTIADSNLNGANRVLVEGQYVYVAANKSDSIGVVDAGNPSAPSLEATLALSDSGGPNGIALLGDWLACGMSQSLILVDISDPTSPTESHVLTDTTFFTASGSAHDLEPYKDGLIVTDQTGNKVGHFSVGSFSAPALNAGSMTANAVYADSYLRAKEATVTDALYLNGRAVLAQDPIFTDRQNEQVGIGTVPSARLQMAQGNAFLENGSKLIVGNSSRLQTFSDPAYQLLGSSGDQAAFLHARFDGTANPAVHRFLKSRNTSIGQGAAVQSGDSLGIFEFNADDGSDLSNRSVRILAAVDGSVATDQIPGRITIETATSGGTLNPALRCNAAQQTVLRPDTAQPGSSGTPVLQLGSGGAGVFIDGNGDPVAVDADGNTNSLMT